LPDAGLEVGQLGLEFGHGGKGLVLDGTEGTKERVFSKDLEQFSGE